MERKREILCERDNYLGWFRKKIKEEFKVMYNVGVKIHQFYQEPYKNQLILKLSAETNLIQAEIPNPKPMPKVEIDAESRNPMPKAET